eukprot:GDKI01039621.1.p1 GENE.GDKI01039621.1~~GDKI01039621.1.p1  ORF type:complete len:350 (-),score=83.59 GDKI01039621.1:145-1119(-)
MALSPSFNASQRRPSFSRPEDITALMGEPNAMPLKYFVAVDGSDDSLCAYNLTLKHLMPRTSNNIVVGHVAKEKEYLPPHMQANNIKARVEADLVTSFPKSRYELHWMSKDQGKSTKEQIVRAANEKTVDFLVLGFQGRKGNKAQGMLGSTSDFSIRYSSSSVIVVKNVECARALVNAGGRAVKFVVCVDDSVGALKAILDALRLSKSSEDKFILLHVAPLAQEQLQLSARIEAVRAKYERIIAEQLQGRNVEFRVVQKTAGIPINETIVSIVEDECADFAVLGADGMNHKSAGDGSKDGYYIGSTSDYVVRNAHCTVIVSHAK